ncbi:MAG: ATPase domain-containing protein [Candidatus Thermoplasmatota archaeon]|nr:ATPase domain-containing protein [Candidatus Thermoplasmatota archaeon]
MTKMLKTYVEGLDDRMEGGFPQGKIILMSGPAGSLKSSLMFSILYHNSRDDKKALFITLEQSRESLFNHMGNMGIEIDERDENMMIMDLRFLRNELEAAEGNSVDWLDFIKNIIKGYIEKQGFELVGIDSLNALYAVSNMSNPRKEIFHFFEMIRDIGATCFLVSETHDSNELAFYGVEEFLADGIIQLTMERTGRSISRYIRVVKMREVNHSTDYFPFIVEKGKMHIVTR